jgi:hypothetical protein
VQPHFVVLVKTVLALHRCNIVRISIRKPEDPDKVDRKHRLDKKLLEKDTVNCGHLENKSLK